MGKVKILCFGDSLTEGYSKWGLLYTPYAKSLEEKLKAAWPNTGIEIEVDGVSGDCVIPAYGDFLDRITADCKTVRKPFDWVIVLGGTNDLGYGRTPENIFAALQEIYKVAFDHGSQILALTIPECSAKIIDLDRKRNAINGMITKYGEENAKFHVLDLKTLMPYHSLSEEEKTAIWDDGLHFTPYGYDRIGEHIAKKLVELVVEIYGVPEPVANEEEEKKNVTPERKPWRPKRLRDMPSEGSDEK